MVTSKVKKKKEETSRNLQGKHIGGRDQGTVGGDPEGGGPLNSAIKVAVRGKEFALVGVQRDSGKEC